ncbi:uncharacterized protein CcaverHIS019_0109700 [Cutaneotrichosporon cavernicola]|uniref:Uncharacterized protein n=1 Tax=Cutaneotrichosporon cavernicola TaxID=279322 RepID=A0AA48L113_9TREE|nr:uncharacterized protein CcaverHIS019_0109700 [Cutaneotrichosporon cavernicola]BEI88252.1 hypothetical protein CcaverHIS019_0109700 [Cutaneotrichosporon cavernicola]BEI96024.1 hypothetical protein CcaverHIS631_0109730 [Cutaneotrichosporon cavernicola]BEJ03797.1 hypothetical protein CcaverHIS641_0109720 [Cutaneotrichosporon cavernicola]
MPPITSPRRTVLHSPPAPLRPVPVPIPGAPVPPLSSSASTFASTPPSAGTSPGTSLGSVMARTLSHGASSYGHSHGHSHSNSSHTGSLGHAPYMVALAGWPEPLFVAERELWDVRKRSRPTTPTGFRGEVRDGVACPLPASLVNAAPTNGLVHPQPVKSAPPQVHAPIHSHSLPLSHRRSRPGSPTGFPTSSARDAPPPGPESAPSSSASTPPRHDAPGPNPLSGTLARLALGDHRERVPNPTLAARTVRRHIDKLGGFSDPRYHANAAVVGRGRSLRVAPAWASSTPVQPYADRPPSGHGRGWPAVSRAVPEVWPPPGVIAQVYPRDPDTIFYPRAGSSGEEDEPACKAARTVVTEAERKREREASASAPEDKDKEEVKVERGMDVDR